MPKVDISSRNSSINPWGNTQATIKAFPSLSNTSTNRTMGTKQMVQMASVASWARWEEVLLVGSVATRLVARQATAS